MIPKQLQQAWQAYSQEKVWKALQKRELFAVRRDEGELIYAVMCGDEIQNGLMVFEHEQAMAEYAMLVKKYDISRSERLLLEVEGLCCTVEESPGEAARLCIRRRRFARVEDTISVEEAQVLADVMRAAVQLARMCRGGDWKLNTFILTTEALYQRPLACAQVFSEQERILWSDIELPEQIQLAYPALMLKNELAMARMRKKKMVPNQLYCTVGVLPFEVEGMEGYPVFMLFMDDQKGQIDMPVVNNFEEGVQRFAAVFLDYIIQEGRPARVNAGGMRAYCLLRDLAEGLDIPIECEEESEQMRQFIDEYVDYALNGREDEDTLLPERPAYSTSRGICLLCERGYTAGGMTRHVRACAASHRQAGETEYLLLRVDDREEKDYWMYLEVRADATLKQLDQFLRKTWVECCGHMSVFLINRVEFLSARIDPSDQNMNVPVGSVLDGQKQFKYEYDFGSPTELNLRVLERYTAKERRKKVTLLARNIQPSYRCVRCGRPAQVLLREPGRPMAECAFCEECAQKEEDYENMARPILNSPRAGLCGYGLWGDEDDE